MKFIKEPGASNMNLNARNRTVGVSEDLIR